MDDVRTLKHHNRTRLQVKHQLSLWKFSLLITRSIILDGFNRILFQLINWNVHISHRSSSHNISQIFNRKQLIHSVSRVIYQGNRIFKRIINDIFIKFKGTLILEWFEILFLIAEGPVKINRRLSQGDRQYSVNFFKHFWFNRLNWFNWLARGMSISQSTSEFPQFIREEPIQHSWISTMETFWESGFRHNTVLQKR